MGWISGTFAGEKSSLVTWTVFIDEVEVEEEA